MKIFDNITLKNDFSSFMQMVLFCLIILFINICFIYIFVSEFNEKILTNLYQVLKNKLDVNNVKEERNSLESTIAVKAY